MKKNIKKGFLSILLGCLLGISCFSQTLVVKAEENAENLETEVTNEDNSEESEDVLTEDPSTLVVEETVETPEETSENTEEIVEETPVIEEVETVEEPVVTMSAPEQPQVFVHPMTYTVEHYTQTAESLSVCKTACTVDNAEFTHEFDTVQNELVDNNGTPYSHQTIEEFDGYSTDNIYTVIVNNGVTSAPTFGYVPTEVNPNGTTLIKIYYMRNYDLTYHVNYYVQNTAAYNRCGNDYSLSGCTISDSDFALAKTVELNAQSTSDIINPDTIAINGYTYFDSINANQPVEVDGSLVVNMYYLMNTPIPTPVPTATPNPGRTCQDDGYAAGYYWNGTACVIDSTPAPEVAAPAVNTVIPAVTTTTEPTAEPTAEATETPTTTTEPTFAPSATPEVAVVTPTTTDDAQHPEYGNTEGSWSLTNLVSAVVAMLLGIILLVQKGTKETEDENGVVNEYTRNKAFKVLAVILGIASIATFVFTENITKQMVLADKYTVLMLVLALGSVVTYVLGTKWKKAENETNEM